MTIFNAALIMSHGLRAVVFASLFAFLGPALAQTDSLWGPTATPGTIDDGDPGSVELGVKFTGSVSGAASTNRFYQGPRNTGRHTVSLWSSAGSRLATATSTSETASGGESPVEETTQ